MRDAVKLNRHIDLQYTVGLVRIWLECTINNNELFNSIEVSVTLSGSLYVCFQVFARSTSFYKCKSPILALKCILVSKYYIRNKVSLTRPICLPVLRLVQKGVYYLLTFTRIFKRSFTIGYVYAYNGK